MPDEARAHGRIAVILEIRCRNHIAALERRAPRADQGRVIQGQAVHQHVAPGGQLGDQVRRGAAAAAQVQTQAGPHPGGGHSQGWQYDPKRRLVFVLSVTGEAWALRLDPEKAQLLDTVPK